MGYYRHLLCNSGVSYLSVSCTLPQCQLYPTSVSLVSHTFDALLVSWNVNIRYWMNYVRFSTICHMTMWHIVQDINNERNMHSSVWHSSSESVLSSVNVIWYAGCALETRCSYLHTYNYILAQKTITVIFCWRCSTTTG